ncbi:hypothetical protein [Psychrobacter vallis]|uniref:hypothetical protein n=1 Tax=Psychrobacter vallis TaxID=248451 RepID=UPI001918B6EC|nr:hypothetical protein [Psychrobacter vallis]
MSEVIAGQIWRNKETKERFLVLWVSDELVTCQGSSKTPIPMRKFIFMQDFEEQGDE